mgnify:FL=1
MKKILFLALFFMLSCTTSSVSKKDLNFNDFDEISFENFKLKLNEYAKKSTYPQIDK